MRKLLVLFMVLVLSTASSYAVSFGQALRNAFRQDVKNVKTEVKTTNRNFKNAVKSDIKETKQEIKDTRKSIRNQIKSDIEESKKAREAEAAARKKEAIKNIDSNIKTLKKELNTVKKDKNISETERVVRTRAIEKQIKYYNKQKAALQ